MCIIKLFLNLNIRPPSHVTISNWVKKIGYYQLEMPKKQAEDWIIIIDESIQLGPEKLLVILSVRASTISFTRPLKFEDLEVITLKSKKGWNAEHVKVEIEKAGKKLGKISYAVSDKGASITKALELCNIRQVHDITHRISNIVKKIYKKDIGFNEYIKALSGLRLQLQQSSLAHIMPPQQRSKCRFMNLKPLSGWGLRAIRLVKQEKGKKKKGQESKEIINKLEWLIQKEAFILEMEAIMEVIEKIFTLTKTQGLNNKTIKKCNQYMKNLKTPKETVLKQELEEYFKEVRNSGISDQTILCTSDVIESAFGKYKMVAGTNTTGGITDIALVIPALTSILKEDEVKKIMEGIKTKQVKEWANENIGHSLLKRRLDVFNTKFGVKIKSNKAA